MRDYCDAQAGFWLHSKFWSKFSRKPLSGIEDQKAPPPISENFRFGMTKVYSGIPPTHFGKLQIWDDQSLLWNTPPISKNFRFGMTKVYSTIPSHPHFGKLQTWGDQSLLRNTPPPQENCQRVQVRDFLNTEIYYMWRLYPTRITTSCQLYCLFCISATDYFWE